MHLGGGREGEERVLFPAVGELIRSTAHSIPAGPWILHLPLISSHPAGDRIRTESWDPSWDIWECLCHSHKRFLAAEQFPCLEQGCRGQTLTRSLELCGIKGSLPLQSCAGILGWLPAPGWSRDLCTCSCGGKGPKRNSGLYLHGRWQQPDLNRLTQSGRAGL